MSGKAMSSCITLHHTASHCITLHRAHVGYNCAPCIGVGLHHPASHCKTLHNTAAHRSTLQHTASSTREVQWCPGVGYSHVILQHTVHTHAAQWYSWHVSGASHYIQGMFYCTLTCSTVVFTAYVRCITLHTRRAMLYTHMQHSGIHGMCHLHHTTHRTGVPQLLGEART